MLSRLLSAVGVVLNVHLCELAENSSQPYETEGLSFLFNRWSFINMGCMNEPTAHTVPKDEETEARATDKQ